MLDRTGRRLKDNQWTVIPGTNGDYSFEAASLAVLMDIRDELKSLNGLLRCPNFLEIPHLLRGIKRNTNKPGQKKNKTTKSGK